MLFIHRSRIHFLVSAALLFSSLIAPAQSTAPPAQASAAVPAVSCAPMADLAISSRAAIEVKVTGLDTAHLKPGKDVWFKIARPFLYPGCSLDVDSVVYAHIMSVSSTKNPGSSELSLAFDRADCNHRNEQPFKL